MNKKEKLRKEYIRRINMAMDFIDNNYSKNISLEDVAKAAYFSPFHFHRVFSTLVGETVNNFITRRRIEKSAVYLLRGYDYSISEIAEMNGFNSPAAFSRAFKKYYGTSASDMQNMVKSQFSKICKVDSKNCKNKFTIETYICNVEKILNSMNMKTNVEVKEMPEFKVAYMRHTGEYIGIGKVFEKLYMWAMKNACISQDTKAISVYHDDPKVTEPEKVRTSACLTMDKDFKPEGEVGMLTVKKGKYAVGHFEVSQSEFGDAWNYMCAWTIENGYEEGDGDYYEIYCNNHKEHPEGKFIVDICIPVN
jgi:AraC family transcriptional regulator